MKRFLLAAILLAGCVTAPEEDNFKRVMSRQVGKQIDDTDAYPVLYRLKQTNSARLANGNLKEEYAVGRQGKCRVAFEVSPARTIVGWSSEGDSSDCVIPRTGRTP